MKRVVIALLALLGVIAVLGAAVLLWLPSESGRAWIAQEIARRASTPGETLVSIGRLEGDLYHQLRFADIRVADSAGDWLTVGSAKIDWQPLGLLRGKLVLDRVDIRNVAVARLPETPPSAKEPSLAERLDALRDLPAIRIRDLNVEDVALGQPVVGERAVLRVTGHVEAVAPSAIQGKLSVRRMDGPAGSLDATGAYDADRTSLTLNVSLAEPAGGLIARALDVPALPALQGEAKGAGPLSDWKGHVAFSFAQVAAMRADVAIRHTTATDFTVDGTATIPPGDRGFARRLVSGAHRFRVDGSYKRGDVLTLSQMQWTAPLFTFAAGGTMNLDTLAVDGRASLKTTRAGPLTLAPADASIGALTAEITASGRLPAPDLTVAFDAGHLAVADAGTGDLHGTFALTPQGRNRGRVDGTATLDAIKLAGRPAVQALLGDKATLRLSGGVDFARSLVTLDKASVAAAAGELSGSGRYGWADGNGTAKAMLSLPDLAALKTAAAPTLTGHVTVSLDAALRDFGDTATGRLSGAATDLNLGNTAADAILTRTPKLDAELSLAGGKLAIKPLTVTSAAADLQFDAALDTASGAVSGTYRVNVAGGTPLRAADNVAVDCVCRLSGRLRGTLQKLGVTGDLAVQALRAEPVALRALAADYDLGGLPNALSGTVKLKAATPVGPATAQTKVALAQDRLRLSDLQAEAATATARGALDLPLTDAPATGDIALDVKDLKAWFTAAGLDGGGSATGQVKLRADGKRQVVDGAATIAKLRLRGAPGAPGIAFDQVAIDAGTTDLGAGDKNKIDIRMTKGAVGAAALARVALTAQGSPSKARLSVSAKGDWKGALAVDAAGDYAEKGGRRSLDLTRLDGALIGEKLALQKPLRLAWGESGVTAEPVALALGDARLSGHARTGKESADVSLNLTGAPLKLIDAFWPLGLNGKADGTLEFKGRWPEAAGKLSLAVPRLRLGDAPDAPALAIDVNGDWRRGRLALNGTIKANEGAPSVIEASLPLRLQGPDLAVSMPREQPVSGTLNWSGDAAALWRFVPIPEHLVRGPAKIDLTLSGTLAKPSLRGTMALTDGYYESLEFGTVLKPINMVVTFDGTHARLTRFTAGDGGAGKIEATGDVALDPDAGFPFEITGKLAKLTAVRRDDVQASASGDVKLSGTLKKLRIASKLTTDHVEIRILDRLPPDVATLNVVEVGQGQNAAPATEEAETGPPVNVDLAIEIAMPRRVFVRGRGIDSEWKGDLKISGTARNPRVAGTLTLVRGQMTVVGKTFQLDSGTLSLPDSPNAEPQIALKAVYTGSNLTVTATVSGSVTKPSITLSSSPSMPQDEIVSNVLFNKSSTKLSPYEAAQLGLALADLTGESGGGVLDFARKTLGVDVLRIESTQTTKGSEPVLGAGKYVTKDVYVGVKQGATPESSSVGVTVDLTPHISVDSDVKRSGQSDVGVKFKLDY